MKTADRIIIGSSPLAIIEAVYLKSKNLSVINIEERNSIGGAWTTLNQDGFPKIEIGCHIWSYNKEAYQLISDLFEIKLIELNPQPSILYKKKMIPYDWKSNVIAFQRIIKNIPRLKQTFLDPEVRLSLLPSKYLYPPKGALDLINSIDSLIKRHRLEIHLNTLVDKVVLKKDRVELFDLNNNLLGVTNELILTSLSKISKIILEDGEEILVNTRKVDYIHAHLILENVSGKSFSYIRTNGNNIIHRVSDMTFQVKDQLKNNQKLFCVGIFSKSFYEKDTGELKSNIYDFFLENKLVSKDTKIVKFLTNVYPSYYNDSVFISEISNKSNGKIRFLRSTDFVYSFYNQKERYKDLLSYDSK